MSPVTASSSSIHNATASTTTVMISSSEWHDEDYDILAEALFDEAPTAECLTTVPVATVHATSSSAPPVPATTSESTTTVTTIATSASPASPRSVAIVSPVSSSCDLTQSSTPPPVNHTHKKKKKQPTKKTTQPDSTVATKKQRVSSQGSSVSTATATASTLKHKKASPVKPTSTPSPSTQAPASSSSSSASSRSTPATPPQPPSRGIPKQPSLALTQFLKAVSVTNQEARQHQKQSTLALGDMTPAEQVEFRRERNRCLAKQTRQRKKVQMTALKQQLQVLYQEHLKLHAICVQQQIVDVQDDDEQEAPLTSPGLDKIPKAVWDATGIAHAGATDDDDDEDDDLDDNGSDDGSRQEDALVAPQSLTPAESSVPLLEEPVVPTPAPSSSSMTPLPVEQDESALLPPLTVPHPQPDEDSMLLMTILKDHHDTDDMMDHEVTPPVASSSETTSTTCLPPLSMITDDDASSQSGSSVATTTGVPTSSSSMEDPMVMPEFSIPNPLAALAHVPETTAPATTTTMSLFGKPVVLSASSSK